MVPRNELKGMDIGGKVIYVLLVTLIAVVILPIIYVDVFMRTTDSGLLYFLSIPTILVLSGLSFIFQKLYKAQPKLRWRLFVLFVNSFFAFGFGMVITRLIVGYKNL